MLQAIIYTSNTGTTERYAKLLGEKINLPVYPLCNSKSIQNGAEIIYLGWLMAGKVKGYKKAGKRFKVCALCGVGMGRTSSQIEDVRKQNAVTENIPIFTMQGGFNINKLHGIYKFMMNIMLKTAGKSISEKQDKTPEEEEMLNMMKFGGDFVSAENLASVIEWAKSTDKESEK